MGTNTDITHLHEEIFILLSEMRKNNPKLRFTFRKSNHAGRLEDGYWFYGNDSYLAISFWTGMDWKNRTPNIVFIITSSGECYLEINVSDSTIKRDFAINFLNDRLNVEDFGRKYLKHYENLHIGPIDMLQEFINTDKIVIDRIVEEYQFFFENAKEEDRIGLISKEEFAKRHEKIVKYRDLKLILEDESEDYFWNLRKPSKIKEIRIHNYGRIENLILQFRERDQFIFFTGPNGSGKTLLLRAIAAIIGNKALSKKDSKYRTISDFSAEGTLFFKGETRSFQRSGNVGIGEIAKPMVQGLAMYGPYRLDVVDESISNVAFRKQLRKRESFLSLFGEGEKLLNIDKQLSIWRKEKPQKFGQLKYYIQSVLTDVVPGLIKVEFEKDENGKNKNIYVFLKEDGSYNQLDWEDLSSGTKSVFALLGDILIRLYNYQKSIVDPSEFSGVVIIDEIDLHLHPQAQKDLVFNLSKTFPRVQFIVSTHSPIPLLGANKNTCIYRVSSFENSIKVDRLTKLEKNLANLLPDHLLTSELFGLDSIRSIMSEKDASKVFTGSTMTEYNEFVEDHYNSGIKDADNRSFIEKLKLKLDGKSK